MAIERVSISTGGIEAGLAATAVALSADGRAVAFQSRASELVQGDGNNSSDVFLVDRDFGELVLVSATPAGGVAARGSFAPSIAGNGRIVAFESDAGDLVADDLNGLGDIFARDMVGETTVRVSVSLDGGDPDGASANPAISANGDWLAFESLADNLSAGDADGVVDIFLASSIGPIIKASFARDGGPADGSSSDPSLSALGRYLAFASDGTNLVEADTNGKRDVFVFDRLSGEIDRVSEGKRGLEANSGAFDPAISSEGRFVAFHSGASNLVKNDRNGFSDIFVVDQFRNKIVRASVGPKGVEADGDFSPSLSANGRFVTFHSDATNLVANDTNGTTDVFVFDTRTKKTLLVSDPPGLAPADGASFSEGNSLISGNGTVVAFTSSATNLVDDDTNGVADAFVGSVLFPSRRGAARSSTDELADRPIDAAGLLDDGAPMQVHRGSAVAEATPLPVDPSSLLSTSIE